MSRGSSILVSSFSLVNVCVWELNKLFDGNVGWVGKRKLEDGGGNGGRGGKVWLVGGGGGGGRRKKGGGGGVGGGEVLFFLSFNFDGKIYTRWSWRFLYKITSR